MTIPARFQFGTISKPLSPSSAVRFARNANDGPSVGHDVVPSAHGSLSNSRPMAQPTNGVGLRTPSTCHSAYLDGYPDEPAETPHWQQDLDDHIACVFERCAASLAQHLVDDAVASALRVIQYLTREKVCGLALAVCAHWTRMQFRYKNVNVRAPEIVAVISTMANHLGRLLARAQRDFLHDLGRVCIEKLKLTWRWYVDVVIPGSLPVPRDNLFMRVMAVVAMITHLFHGGLVQFDAVLHGLGYIAAMSPWSDAVAVLYAFLHGLGPEFALERAAWCVGQRLLTELSSFAVDRDPVGPLSQLVAAIRTLVAEWQNRTRVTLYHT